MAQVNFGEVGSKLEDSELSISWHVDSVPYVVVLLLSDTTDMVGAFSSSFS